MRASADSQRAELTADIYSTLDQVDVSTLPPTQRAKFLERQMKVGKSLRDQQLTDRAYTELEAGRFYRRILSASTWVYR